MSAVASTIDIAAPPSLVWGVAMDPLRLGEWVTIHRRLEDHAPGRMEQVLSLRGMEFHVSWTLTRSTYPNIATWEGRGPARSKAAIEYRLTEIDGGTRFHYRNEFKAPFGPLGATLGRALVHGISEREAHTSLERLKALCEQS